MTAHYWAVRPADEATYPRMQYTRIERAETPEGAARLAYGRGLAGFVVKDLGTRVRDIQTGRTRIALLTSDEGWLTAAQVQAITFLRSPNSVRLGRSLEWLGGLCRALGQSDRGDRQDLSARIDAQAAGTLGP